MFPYDVLAQHKTPLISPSRIYWSSLKVIKKLLLVQIHFIMMVNVQAEVKNIFTHQEHTNNHENPKLNQ